MQHFRNLIKKNEQLNLDRLAQVLSRGLDMCDTDFEKRELGYLTMKAYDIERDTQIDKYLKFDGKEITHKVLQDSTSIRYFNDLREVYYRNMIYRDASIMLKNIIWNPKVTTPIHGHNSRGWWVLITQGELVEKVFTRENGEPQLIDEKILKKGDVTYNHNAIGFHLMQNDSESVPAITLHWYHPPYDTTAIMRENGEIFTGGLSYYSKYGKVEQHVETGGDASRI